MSFQLPIYTFTNDINDRLLDALLLDLSVRYWGDELILLFQIENSNSIGLVFSLCEKVEYTTDASIRFNTRSDGKLISTTRFDQNKVYNTDNLSIIPYYYQGIKYNNIDNKHVFDVDLSMMHIKVVCRNCYIEEKS